MGRTTELVMTWLKMDMAAGERLDLEHARRHLQAPGSTLTTQEKAIATNFLVGGTWDVPRLLKARYEVAPADQLCQLCGKSIDTLRHRLLECQAPEAQDLRQQLLPKHIASWLAGHRSVFNYRADRSLLDREEKARRLAEQGLARDPSVGQPAPAE